MPNRHPALKRVLSLLLSFATAVSCLSFGGSGSAEAAASLPYIEELKGSQQGGAFKILEIAPSAQEGSIGYYIGGCEPCRAFPSQAAADPSCCTLDAAGNDVVPGNHREDRVSLVQSKLAALVSAGILSKSGTDAPLTKLCDYDEKYPWDLVKDASLSSQYVNALTLRRGSADSDVYFEKVGSDSGGGVTGVKFTAKPDPLPDGAMVDDYAYIPATRYALSAGGSYVQDIAYFTADSSQIAQLQNAGDQLFYYAPVFETIRVSVTPGSGPDGSDDGTQRVSATYLKDGTTASLPDGTAVYANEADYSAKLPSPDAAKHIYYYLGNYYSSAYSGERKNEAVLDDAHTYYFVSSAGAPTDLAPEAQPAGTKCSYAAVGTGFHTPAAPGESACFAPEGGMAAFKYVGAGNGRYKCEASPGDRTPYTLYTSTVYYPNCFQNNEWFKRYVFDCSDAELKSFKCSLSVETLAPDDPQLTADEAGSASLIFLSNGLKLEKNGVNSAAYSSDLPSDTADPLNHRSIAQVIEHLADRGGDASRLVTPLLVDSRVADCGQKNLRTLALYARDTLGAGSESRVKGSVYWFVKDSAEFATKNFQKALAAYSDNPSEPYREVAETIRRTNNQRLAQNPNAALVDTTISMATCVRHIINAAMPTSAKTTIRVLDIEPGNPYGGVSGSASVLTPNTVLNTWLQGQGFNSAEITTWSTSEFIARFNQTTYDTSIGKYETSELDGSFDIIYIGTNIDRFAAYKYGNSGLNQTVVNYADTAMRGLVYTNIGDTVSAGKSSLLEGQGYTLSGSLDRDYRNNDPGTQVIDTTRNADRFRFSGNDLTARAKAFFESYADAGHPLITANDLYSKLSHVKPESAGKLRFSYSRDGWLIDYSGGFDILSYSYVITADKTTLTVSPSIGDLSSSSDNVFSAVRDAIKSWLEDLKANLERANMQWYVSYNGADYQAISGATGLTLDISAYPQGASFYCTAALPETSASYSSWSATYYWGLKNEPAAVSQVVRLTKNAVNDERVDSSSQMYQFLNDVKGRTNVFSEGDFASANKPDISAVSGTRTRLGDLVSISSPSIVFTSDDGSRPIDYSYETDSSGSISHMSGITPDADGKCSLTYKFTIKNPSDPALRTTRYGCDLYVDENGDGSFAASEKLSNVDVYCSDRRVTSLQASSAERAYIYSISRPMPDDFCGIIPWKLEIYKLASDGTSAAVPAVAASQTGFSHINANGSTRPKKNLRILQITPNDYSSRSWIDAIVKSYQQYAAQYNTIHLSSGWCKNMLASNPDYAVSVTEHALNSAETSSFDKLDQYDMLILGFGNSYGEMTQASAEAISQFIDTGKAVLFSDDCASSFFIGKQDAVDTSGKSVYGGILKNLDFFNLFSPGYHGYYFNTTLRDAVGLDRYGVSSKAAVKAAGSGGTAANTYLSSAAALESSGYSVAYKPKSGGTAIVPETQGLTNNLLMAKFKSGVYPYGYYDKNQSFVSSVIANITNDFNAFFQRTIQTTHVTQVNKGQITSYPYNVNTGKNGGNPATNGVGDNMLQISTTHMQPMQLNMNRGDVRVWYCLAGDGDGSAGGSSYDYNTNDAVNQYYIYSRGNVTYTGMGHIPPSTDAEKQLLVNTIIAAARQGQSAPSAVFTDPEGGKTNISAVLVPSDENGALPAVASSDRSRRIYFKLQDTSLVPSAGKTFSAAFAYQIGSGEAETHPFSPPLPVYNGDGTLADSGALTAGQVYYVRLDDLLFSSDVKDNLGRARLLLTPYVTRTVSGNPRTYAGNPVSVTLTQFKLFNLG